MKRNSVPLSACFILLLAGCSKQSENKPQVSSKETAPVAYFKVDPTTVGTLTGKINFKGKKPSQKTIDMNQDSECERLHGKQKVLDQSIVVNKNGTLSNVFVYIKAGLEGKKFEVSSPVTIDQNGCWFHPRVLGIQTGQTLQVTNSDPVTHNIHPQPEINREWNHSQAQGDPPITRKFLRPEVMVRVKCNVHSWMRAFIGVVDHPYFAVTGADGSFEIKNVPPGTYTLASWQEKLGEQEQQVTVSPSGKVTMTFAYQGE